MARTLTVEVLNETIEYAEKTGQEKPEVLTALRNALVANAALRADVERLRSALNNIDAIDPEAMIDGFSEHAIKGLVHTMGAIARAALGAS